MQIPLQLSRIYLACRTLRQWSWEAVASGLPHLSAAPQAEGIATYLKGNPDYTVAAKFVQLADAPAIFGDSPEAGIVLFAASDSAWKTAADALGD